MKKLLAIACLLAVSLVQAQDKEPTYEAVGDLVKATYYYEDGTVHKQGFFKDLKLTGQWTEFDKQGNKIAVGYYKGGKKVGTWFQWKKNILRQINYENNVIASVSTWKEDTKVAVNK
ncbi:toxin-antitoxin system YwqK family antitoxin [Pseudotenacibaculum haliotis]|uniref:Toxin-antitoxin system YwqK family antitoxin n=1 Tax=Pseudotenacibaculum haliotis TaxID=1862138 RepID=A0ABW5LSH4_9FLAO